jgi:magnesium chelatase subunit D
MGHRGGGELRASTATAASVAGVLRRGLWAVEPAGPEPLAELELELDGDVGRSPAAAGRGPRRYVTSDRPYRGRYVRAAPAANQRADLALDVILRDPERALKRRIRVVRPGRLVLFVVDISGSMGTELIGVARRVALSLLADAYLRRDRVALAAFRGERAELVFGPTSQAGLVKRELSRLTGCCGGTTPLGAALALAQRTLTTAALTDPGRRQTLVLISDGRANVGRAPGHRALLGELERAARTLARRRDLRRLFLDTTEPGKDDRRAAWLEQELGAERVRLGRVGADRLVRLVKWT